MFSNENEGDKVRLIDNDRVCKLTIKRADYRDHDGDWEGGGGVQEL